MWTTSHQLETEITVKKKNIHLLYMYIYILLSSEQFFFSTYYYLLYNTEKYREKHTLHNAKCYHINQNNHHITLATIKIYTIYIYIHMILKISF